MSKIRLIIGNKNYSSWSLRPWLALKQTGLTFEEMIIPLDQSDSKQKLLEYSPQGLVPVLLENDFLIGESLAILERVAELAPAARLWPEDAKARAMARYVSAEMHAGFFNLRKNCPMNIRKSFPNFKPAEDVLKDLKRISEIWHMCRKTYGQNGPFLFGHFTNADAMYAPVCTRIRTYHLPMDDLCQAYIDTIYALPAFKEWHAAAEKEEWIIEATEVAGLQSK